MKYTYYVVQTKPDGYLRQVRVFAPATVRDAEEATRFTLPEARSVIRTACRSIDITDGAGRRFPRIIKVTTETKTIKERR